MRKLLGTLFFIAIAIVVSCDSDSDDQPFQKESDLVYERRGGIFGMLSNGSDTVRISPTDVNLKIDIDGSNPISPDGSMLMTIDDNRGLVLVKLDGSGVSTPVSSEAYYAGWSPDGNKILYVKKVSSSSLSDIYVVNSDGTNPQNITQSPANYRSPRWTNDGRIVFTVSASNSAFELAIINADGSGRSNIVTGIEAISDFRLSNSTSKVAINGQMPNSNQRGIYTLNLDGSSLTLLTEVNSRRIHDWSPDDSKLLYTTQNATGEFWNVFVISTDGSGTPVNLSNRTETSDKGWNPSWSITGSEVVFSIRDFSNLRGYDIYKANADGSGLTNLTNYSEPIGGHFSAFWCPF
ncbi:PD40 domain-containing protein [Roseivirga sp. E12]|uniref:TolB family protein n=1 Tax=Roseivirga sp. E12 TaxID=2819237 RepID=UPI001ABC2AF9|nr:PD40 domain-containing protein [Roseivirga sp. E12]MBO3698620.1 PD40 domain-containing protein [Roseivirga sp. E12]